MHARVLLLLEWLDRAKDFILLNTEFVAPRKSGTRDGEASAGKFLFSEDPGQHRTSGEFCTYEAPKQGILVRSMSHAGTRPSTNHHPSSQILAATPVHTVTLKITLKESDLVLIEQPENGDSLALVAFTTAVVTANDASGQMEASYEIQVPFGL